MSHLFIAEGITYFLVMSLMLAIAASLILLLVDYLHPRGVERPGTPMEIIAYRYARGEIDDAEFGRLRNALEH
jgi:uncharacterized membrane protein